MAHFLNRWLPLFTGRTHRRRIARRASPDVELLEDRTVPATFDLSPGVTDGALGSLRAAILAANANGQDDIINLSAGTYNLSLLGVGENASASGDLDLTEVGKMMTIRGAGSASTIIDASGVGDRAFEVLAGVTAVFENVTITGGLAGAGAGISNLGTLTVRNSVFTANSASAEGGALYSAGGGSVTVEDSTFHHNRSTAIRSGAAGISLGGGSVMIRRCTFDSNSAYYGGGVGGGGDFEIHDSIFSNNTATRNAGALGAGGNVRVFDTTFVNNSSTWEFSYSGGAIKADQGTNLTLTRCVLRNNSGPNGGAIHIVHNAIVHVIDSEFSGNNALSGGKGGAIYTVWNSTLDVVNSTLVNNTASAGGGGIYNDWGSNSVTIANSTITGNRGGGLSGNALGPIHNTIVAGNFQTNGVTPSDVLATLNASSSYNLIGTGGSGGLTNTNGNQVGVSNPGLGTLGNHGGSTQTVPLLAGSPAIDMGNPTFAPPPSTDQRGSPRVNNGRIDIGAYEVETPPTVSFALASQSAAESVGSTTITATLSQAALVDVTVPLTLSGTATVADDFALSSTALLIPAGSTTASITVTVVDDTTDEDAETLILTMGAPSYGILGATTVHTLTIEDNDASPLVAFTVDSQRVAETAGVVQVTARLSDLSVREVTVPLTFSGSAQAPGDYTSNATSIVIPAGQAGATINVVTVANDGVAEGNESIVVALGNPVNAVLSPVAPVSHSITIAGSPLVSFVTNYWRLDEAAAAPANRITVTAQLSELVGYDVLAPLTFGGSAEAADYTLSASTITIPAGAQTGSVTLTVRDDAVAENDHDAGSRYIKESLQIGLSPSANARVSTQKAVVDIVDDDVPLVYFADLTSESPPAWKKSNATTVYEDAGSVTVTARLSKLSENPVTVPISVTGSLGEFQSLPASFTLTVPAMSREASRSFNLVDDHVDEVADESVKFQMGTPTGASIYSSTYKTYNVTVHDDDPTVYFATSGSGRNKVSYTTSVDEGKPSVSIPIYLTHATNQDVTVRLEYSGKATGTGSKKDYTRSSAVTIPKGKTSAMLTLAITPDSVQEPPEDIIIRMSSVDNGYALRGSSLQREARVTIEDNDFPTLSVSGGWRWPSFITGEDDGVIEIKATLPGPAFYDVTFDMVVTGGTATVHQDYVLEDYGGTGGSPLLFKIPAGQTEAYGWVHVLSDSEHEVEEWFDMEIRNVKNARFSGRTIRSVIIRDNDPVLGESTTVQAQSNQPSSQPPGGAYTGSLAIDLSGAYAGEVPPALPVGSVDNTGFVIASSAGYVSGSTAFFDANRNQVLDFLDLNSNGVRDVGEPMEPGAITTIEGGCGLIIPEAFDLNGNGTIDHEEGEFVLVGGTDISTRLPTSVPMRAPVGSFVISPFTTLMSELMKQPGVTLDAAQQRVLAALDLPGVDLTQYVYLNAMANGDPQAAQFFAADVKLLNTITQATGLLSRATGAPSTSLLNSLVIKNLAGMIATPESGLELGNETMIQTILLGVANETGHALGDDLLTGAAAVIAASNQYIDQLALQGSLAYMGEVVKAQVVAQGDAATALGDAAAGLTPIADVVAAYTGQPLADRIAVASIGPLLPPVLWISDVIQVEGNSGQSLYEFTVNLAGTSEAPVSVQWKTADYTAAAGSDYAGGDGTLTWAPGDNTPRTIQVAVNGDTSFESDEQFLVQLSYATNAVLRKEVGYGLIANDEALTYVVPTGGAGNQLTLYLADGMLELERNGQVVLSGTFSQPLPILIQGANGVQNTLTLHVTGSNPILGGGVTFLGGDQANDALTMEDSGSLTVIHTPVGPSQGMLTIDGNLVTYTGVESVLDAVAPGAGASTSTPVEGRALTLSAVVPNPDLADVYAYLWEVTEDGQPFDPGVPVNGATLQFTPPATANYGVKLTISSDSTGTGILHQTLDVSDSVPTAAFTWSPEPQVEGSAVTFTDQSTTGLDAIVSWSWDFAGLGTSAQRNPTFTFSDHGSYTVSLTVTDADGSTNTTSHSVTVSDLAPDAEFTWAPGSPLKGALVSFTDQSTSAPDTIASWSWDFARLGTSDQRNPTFTFANAGVYVVTLTVTDDDGSVSTDDETITVQDNNVAPVLDSSGSPFLTAIDEDLAANLGTTISALIGRLGGPGITDTDAGALQGIALVAADTATGTWEYTTNGNTWLALGAPSDTAARLLAANATTALRFVPAANFSGSVAQAITFHAWDQTVGSNGATADIATIGTGGSTPFSDAVESASIIVRPLADEPMLFVQPAAGDEGKPMPLSISAALTDTDGSETLALQLAGVPASAVFNNGVLNPGTGIVALAPTQLPGLTLTVHDEAAFTLTVTAIATEQPAGPQATKQADLSVVVNNVAPTLTLGGPAVFSPDQPYSLTLAATDPGADTIQSWRIDWGDGAVETIPGSPATVSHSYALVQGTYEIHATATDEDGTFTANALPVTARFSSPNGTFAAHAFLDLMHEPIDPQHLATWQARLDTGQASRGQVVREMLGMQECSVQAIHEVFHELLGRAPTPREVAAGLRRLARGHGFFGAHGGYSLLRAWVIGSNAYWHERAGGDWARFQEAAFRDLLGGRGRMLPRPLVNSPQFRQAWAEDVLGTTAGKRHLVRGWIEEYWHEAGSADLVHRLTSQLLHGASEARVMAELMASATYFQQALEWRT